MNSNRAERVLKRLQDSIPLGEHPSPHSGFISIRLDTVQNAIKLIDALCDELDWTEKGLSEWRSVALEERDARKIAEGTARIATHHLHSVLNTARTHANQIAVDSAARDWLISIGYEPTTTEEEK